MPMLHIPFRGRANLRNHRKLVIVDGQIALAGGMNLAWPYIGPPGSRRPVARSIDGRRGAGGGGARGALCVGLAVHHRPRPDRSRCGPVTIHRPVGMESSVVQVVPSGPDVAGDPLYESLLALVFAARDRIWIVTPYFVPDEMLARALTPGRPPRGRRAPDRAPSAPTTSPPTSPAPATSATSTRPGDASCSTRPSCCTPRPSSSTINSPSSARPTWTCAAFSSITRWRFTCRRRRRSPLVADWAQSLMADSKRELPAPGWQREIFENVVRLLSPLL